MIRVRISRRKREMVVGYLGRAVVFALHLRCGCSKEIDIHRSVEAALRWTDVAAHVSCDV